MQQALATAGVGLRWDHPADMMGAEADPAVSATTRGSSLAAKQWDKYSSTSGAWASWFVWCMCSPGCLHFTCSNFAQCRCHVWQEGLFALKGSKLCCQQAICLAIHAHVLTSCLCGRQLFALFFQCTSRPRGLMHQIYFTNIVRC